MGVFYRIRWDGYLYIGEWSTNNSHEWLINHHLAVANPYPVNNKLPTRSANAYRWEYNMQDRIKQVGYLGTPITEVSEYDEDEVIQRISKSFDDIAETKVSPYYKKPYHKGDLYKDIKNVFKGRLNNPDLQVPEALLIALAAKTEGQILNTHFNMGPHSPKGLTSSAYTILCNVDFMRSREMALYETPAIWLTFNINNLTKEVVEKILETGVTFNDKENVKRNVRGQLNRKFDPILNKRIQESTIESIKKQLNRYLKRIPDDKKKLIGTIIEDVNQQLDDLNGKTIRRLNTVIDESFQKKISEKKLISESSVLRKLKACLEVWFNHSIEDFLPESSDVALQDMTNNYFKNAIYSYVQKNIFGDIFDIKFADARWNRWQIEPKGSHHFKQMHWYWQAYTYAYNSDATLFATDLYGGDPDWEFDKDNTLRSQMFSKVDNIFYYIKSNWKKIYSEQISIYLRENRDPLFTHNMSEELLESKDIKYY